MDISQRKQDILKFIIEDFTKSAEPISSKALCQKLSLSSATIRNEMQELELLGLIIKPHTSAGRIPSDLGYRFYVDNLLLNEANLPVDLNFVNDFMSIKLREIDKLMIETSNIISKLTKYTSVVKTPKLTEIKFKKIDISYVDEKTFALVIILDNNIIRTKLLKSDSALYKEEISSFKQILNKLLFNIDISLINKQNLSILYKLSHLSDLIYKTIEFLVQIAFETLSEKIYIGSEGNLLNYPEYSDGNKAKGLIDFIKNPEMLKFSPTDGVKVRIGVENGDNPLSDASVVYATYKVGANDYGVIGVVGPKRMDYAKVSSYLTLYARQLSDILKNSFLKENDESEELNGR